MIETNYPESATSYTAREVVGVLPSPDALQAGVDELLIAGFDRSAISVLASDAAARRRLKDLYGTVEAAADDDGAPHAAFVSDASKAEGKAAAVAVPFYLGSVAGAAAVVASGGVLAAAIGAAVASGAAGAGLGALLANALSKRHADSVADQLARGGLVLWVGVPDQAAEDRACAVLQRLGATQVHVNAVAHRWGAEDRPLGDVQPDPFLVRSPAKQP
ncbi:MAG: hypothetical protein KGL52_10540 [Rhodospirillales bacterium]|jgi:hypothetical protein|nr:hypothetical protein [Rhodospirillales bacterium]